MHPTLFNLVAWILLFAQGLVSIGAGQTLCIPFQSCGRHAGDHGHSGACGELDACGGLQVERIDGRGPVDCAGHDHDHHHHHHDHLDHGHGHHGHDHHRGDHRDADHRHGWFGGCGGGHVECGCHLHVALPDADLPWRPVDAEASGPVGSMGGVHLAPTREDPRLRRTPPRWPEAFLASDEIRSRAVTRLIV